jgi:hypothetical protein
VVPGAEAGTHSIAVTSCPASGCTGPGLTVPMAQTRHPGRAHAGSSSPDLRMIFIPSPHACRLISKEVLTAACGLPLNLAALGSQDSQERSCAKPRNGGATWAFMTTFSTGSIVRQRPRRR